MNQEKLVQVDFFLPKLLLGEQKAVYSLKKSYAGNIIIERKIFGGVEMVYLAGAGAGDVGLLTLKAAQILKAADVVIYDRLADDAILNLCAQAKKIYVGKKSGEHTFKQSEINKILVAEARQNKIVVRLKGGDPFVFGRGGEEALYLRGRHQRDCRPRLCGNSCHTQRNCNEFCGYHGARRPD